MTDKLPKFTVENVPIPTQTMYAVYHKAVAGLKEGEKVIIGDLDQKTCWKIQSNMKNDLVVVGTRSVKEADGKYTLYLFRKKSENNKERSN